jgi:hypothetical protein
MPMRELARQDEPIRQDLLLVPDVESNILGERSNKNSLRLPKLNWRPSACRHRILSLPCRGKAPSRRQARSRQKGPQVFIRIDRAYDSVQAIADTPIVAVGRTLKLSDVRRGYEDHPTYLIQHQGEPTIMLGDAHDPAAG